LDTARAIARDPWVKFARNPKVIRMRDAAPAVFNKFLWVMGFAYPIVGAMIETRSIFPQPFWTQNDGLMRMLLFAMAFPVLILSVRKIEELQGETKEQIKRIDELELADQNDERRSLLDKACKILLVTIEERSHDLTQKPAGKKSKKSPAATPIPILSLGGTVWRLPKDQKDTKASLEKVGAYKFHSLPLSGVSWGSGHGPAGQCWASQQEVIADLGPLKRLDQRTFEAKPPAKRYWLSWEEFDHIRHYWAIWALPLKDEGGTMIGVMSVNCSKDVSAADTFSRLKGDNITFGVVETLAEALVGTPRNG
jgi:hypothetical protein